MAAYPQETYQYDALPILDSFRVFERLPGEETDPISCHIHTVKCSSPIGYEAASYACGGPNVRAPISCHGQIIEVTQNLQAGLIHLRFRDKIEISVGRCDLVEMHVFLLWQLFSNGFIVSIQLSSSQSDAEDLPSVKAVIVCLAPDNEEHQSKIAINSIITISYFLCQKLGISFSDLSSNDTIYYDVSVKNGAQLPLPNECEFSTDTMWKYLV
jgi:hypothetical protein